MMIPSHLKRPASAAPPSGGFTLLELLLGVVLGAVVLAALGGAVLVSQMRISTRIRTDIERRDALNRAVGLMRSEIGAANKITLNYSGDGNCPQPNLYLEFLRQGQTRVCYTTQLLTSAARYFRQDRPWNGPCVLTRVGPIYKPDNGKLASESSASVIQVILDNMDTCSGGVSSLVVTPGQAISTGSVLRDVDIEIKQTSNINTRFSARVGSNPLLSGNEITPSACLSADSTCHYRIPPVPTNPDPNQKNIYYLNTPYASNSFSNCTYDSCIVSSGSNSYPLKYVDVLVFADREIRP